MNEEKQKQFYKELAQPERFLIHLHGHMHESALEYIRTGGQETIRMAQGAALFSPEAYDGKEKRIHGYSGGRLEIDISNSLGTLNIWPRIVKFPRTIKSGYYLAPDWDNFELDEDDASTTKNIKVNLPDDTVEAKLLRECLKPSPQQLIQEQHQCSRIAQSYKLDDLTIARIRIEVSLLSNSSSDKQQGDEHFWNYVESIAARIKGENTEKSYLKIQTGFELQRTKDGILNYFQALKKFEINEKSNRFLIPVQIAEGFLAPIHLLTGLLDRFDEDWTTVLKAFSQSVSDDALPSWQALQSFIFDCWLLWGPSIPICGCKLWTASKPENAALMLQYGYGDENNSLPVYLTSDQLPVLRNLVWGKTPVTQRDGQHGIARRMALIGTIVSVDEVADRPLPSAQKAALESGKYDYVIEYIDAVLPMLPSRGEYYSAYVWIMFEVTLPSSSGSKVDPVSSFNSLDQRWLRLLPFFEHTNIADVSAYDFMKEQLARKALSFISRYADENTTFQYACAFDDPGHGSKSELKTLFAFSQHSIQQVVENLLAKDEFLDIRPFVIIRPDHPVLTACELPTLVDNFYNYISPEGKIVQ